jgi:hypothetical protein
MATIIMQSFDGTSTICQMDLLLRDLLFFIFGVLTPLSTIFQLYHGDQF